MTAPKTSAVAGHIAACTACRAEVEAFTATLSLLPLSSLSFGESERALVRRRVLDEIARRRRPSPALSFLLNPRYALAALAGVVVLAASLVSPFFVRDAGKRVTMAPNAERPALVATPAPAGPRVAAASPRAADRAARARKASPSPARTSKNPDGVMRLEIQTGNVNVRIIWFAGGIPAGEASAGTGDPNGVS